MDNRRFSRQSAIRAIVRDKPIRSQAVVVDELKAMGFDCTQATVSRDMADMGLRKMAGGVYVTAEDIRLQRVVSGYVLSCQNANNLVVIKTQPGTASGVASALDAALLPNVLGSVAGKDTIMVVCNTNEGAEQLVALFGESLTL